MTPRSYLFVPADRPERVAKALASGADAVIVDLEDAVAPQHKAASRAALAAGLAQSLHDASPVGQAQATPLLVRINASDTPWFEEDLAMCGSNPAVAGVMLPKAERVIDLETVRDRAPRLALIPLIETARGLDQLRALAATQGVHRLAFGSIDLQLDLGMEPDPAEDDGKDEGNDAALLCWRLQIVLASRLAGLLPPIDGVTAAIHTDTPALRDAHAARRLGFGAKLCIHPRQVAAVNAAFTPSEATVRWAHRVLEAAERAGGAAVAVDGQMVDKPVQRRAQAVLDRVRRR